MFKKKRGRQNKSKEILPLPKIDKETNKQIRQLEDIFKDSKTGISC
jgi:hypothetical protein